MQSTSGTFFAPQLIIPSGLFNLDFYLEAFGAIELGRWSNDDGSIHVAELGINGAIFHVHEERPLKGSKTPESVQGVTTIIGLFVPDVDAVVDRAILAGAVLLSPPQDYEYHYRQAEIRDPFGHQWLIEKKI